ncbi:anti-sigma factor family protein [Microtetraspora niveoalba]|uniref:anti-sigma factor family protein n=1 Tax=Microtetraspora niveoalba TaxID=46175 RepID=UPI00083062D5|nr:zf-HC2 domain-containing protein [Microtetraspora niveoalba]
MTCDDVRISLGAYVLGALDDEETAQVEAHLDECPDCPAELAELSGLPPFLARVSEEDIRHAAEPPREVLDRLLAATVRRRRLSRAMLGLAASVVVAALGGTTWMAVARPSADGSAGASTVSAQAQPRSDAAGGEPGAAAKTEARTEADTSADSLARTLTAPATEATGREGNVRMTVRLTPGEGGTSVEATVTGVPAGVVCRLTAVGLDRTRSAVASWSATAQGFSSAPAAFTGSTELRVGEIARFELTTADGRKLVTARVKPGE